MSHETKHPAPASTPDVIPEIVAYITARLTKAGRTAVPDLGIICGSGLGGLASTLKDPFIIAYEDIQGFPKSTVQVCFFLIVLCWVLLVFVCPLLFDVLPCSACFRRL